MTDSTSALDGVLADLEALCERLDALIAERPESDWRRATPAQGWDVATQVGHLMWTDIASLAAIRAIEDKAEWDAIVMAAIEDVDGFVDTVALQAGAAPPAELLADWRARRTTLAHALRTLAAEHPGVKVPWFGPPMSPTSMASARYMETWAHSLDVFDALGVEPDDDDGVRNVCHIGFRTRGFAYANRGLDRPEAEVRLELTAPSGAVWRFGPDDAEQSVVGPAVDFAQLVTQRRHRDDLALVVTGADADAWLDIAQAFAGPPGEGRAPLADTHQTNATAARGGTA